MADYQDLPDQAAMDACAREPIHLLGLVQPHGFLLACEAETGLIRFVSENLSDFLTLNAADCLGQPLSLVIDAALPALTNLLKSASLGAPQQISLPFRHSRMSACEVLMHRIDGHVVIEVTPFPTGMDPAQPEHQVEQVVGILAELQNHQSFDEFMHASAAAIRRLAGYQRVMIYRFLPDWSGEVVAEAVEDGQSTRFLGLRFPASDIPVQARQLYRSNLLRIICDISATPVALLADPGEGVLDLSHSLLRMPSGMHLNYLQNMGVRATMTISLLRDGELWGMVACHHDQPRTPPAQLRRTTKMLCALLAQAAMSRLETLEFTNSQTRRLAIHAALGHLATDSITEDNLLQALQRLQERIAAPLRVQALGLIAKGEWE